MGDDWKPLWDETAAGLATSLAALEAQRASSPASQPGDSVYFLTWAWC